MSHSSIWCIDKTLSGATTPSQSEAGSNGNEEVLHIPQSSRDEALLSDGLIPYPGHLFGSGAYPFAEKQSMYSKFPADWAVYNRELLFNQPVYNENFSNI